MRAAQPERGGAKFVPRLPRARRAAAKKFPRRPKKILHFFTIAPDSAHASTTERRSIAATLRQITGTSTNCF
ncbi:MAG TPA: hypothetical protein VIF14_12615 [Alphaproteobacteria bacterium]